MKRWLGGLMIGGLAIGACALALQHITHLFLQAETYNIEFDNLLSVTAQQSVHHFVKQHFNKIQHAALLKAVKNNFAYIDIITARQKRPGLLHFSVTAARPWLKLNTHTLMTHVGSVVCCSDYVAQYLNCIPTIHVPEDFYGDAATAHMFFTHMQHVDSALFNRFYFFWNSSEHLVLTDKIDPWFCIVCQSSVSPKQDTLAQCERIKEKLKTFYHNKKNHLARTPHYMADVRFAHQIVVTEKGEAHV